MAETLAPDERWLWYSVMDDLRILGGLTGVIIDPLSVQAHGCGGSIGDNHFRITWVHNQFLLLTMKTYSQELVDAFAKIVEYQPFCRYVNQHGQPTVEWDKVEPDKRLSKLRADSSIRELVELRKDEKK